MGGEKKMKALQRGAEEGKKMKSPEFEMLGIVLELFISLPCELIPISVKSAHNLLSANPPGTRPQTRGQSGRHMHVLSSGDGIWRCLRGLNFN